MQNVPGGGGVGNLEADIFHALTGNAKNCRWPNRDLPLAKSLGVFVPAKVQRRNFPAPVTTTRGGELGSGGAGNNTVRFGLWHLFAAITLRKKLR